MRKRDKQTSLRLTPEAKRMIDELTIDLGITLAAVIEMAVRKLYKIEKAFDRHLESQAMQSDESAQSK